MPKTGSECRVAIVLQVAVKTKGIHETGNHKVSQAFRSGIESLNLLKYLIMKALIFSLIFCFALISCNSNSTSQTGDQSDAKITQVTIKVGGMTCTGCEKTISKAITDLDGVKDCKVSHTDSLAIVSYDSTKVNLEAINTSIKSTGYTSLGLVTQ